MRTVTAEQDREPPQTTPPPPPPPSTPSPLPDAPDIVQHDAYPGHTPPRVFPVPSKPQREDAGETDS